MTSEAEEARARSLYLCYLSLDDPLAWTQVVAYLTGLAARGHEVHLLSWEPPSVGAERRADIETRLRDREISWHVLPYHKRPSLPATIYDVFRGFVRTLRLVRRHRLNVLHARSHVPAACALPAARLLRTHLVFDLRGLMAEEFVDAGRWPPGGIAFRIAKRIERAALRRANAIVVLTERVRDLLFPRSDHRVNVIPCCADIAAIDARRGERDAIRDRLGVGDRRVAIYLGKFTGWYLEDEMAEFIAVASANIGNVHFLVVTQSDPELITAQLERRGIPAAGYTITRVPPHEVGGYLAASDFGISFIAAAPSKISSSPTKIGEYLAAGLPLVCGRGIGDVDALLERHDVGVLLDEFSTAAYEETLPQLERLLADPGAPERARRAAAEELSLEGVGVPAYDRIYRSLLEAPDE
jgi:glycosyltransferase involved in cell wall biosynthesis